ncbi:formate/nitrite transporter family protein [Roseomonas sp. M0104]|uniref:Formate/nitrite transporter family protein n=1 Tax=Teichococcus coralli TaxID=2545983 RepID=A0A845BAK1_9PROT|nr:formate/nitrite transporter family protein [Pseudoroseomonas coralli]MXP63648.1 formate/nitrite transporter family protein [Pseudoroseomonas coralli]
MQPPHPQSEREREFTEAGRTEAEIDAGGGPISAEEEEEIEDYQKLRPIAIYEVVRREGVEELGRPWRSLWWSGLAAGLSIGLSLTAQGTLHALLPDAPWRPLVASLGYTVGFLVVIMARQQLFTEVTLTAVLPVLAEPGRRVLGALTRNWAVVFLANMAGTLVFAAMLSLEGVLPPFVREGALAVSAHVVEREPLPGFLRAIFAGWMMALLVWLLPLAETARFWVIALVTYLIALFELSHVIAGSVELFLLMFTGRLGVLEGLGEHLLPWLVGNVLGGAALFSLLAYGQVRDEMAEGGG